MFNDNDKITLDELSSDLRRLILSGSSGSEGLDEIVDAHIKNNIVHITNEERNTWNNKASLESPYFIGAPKALTPNIDDISERLATTKFISQKISTLKIRNAETANRLAIPVDIILNGVVKADNTNTDFSSPVFINITAIKASGLTGIINPNNLTGSYNIDISGKSATAENCNTFAGHSINDFALIQSPIFKGIPKVPTALEGDSSKQIANTEYVSKAIANISIGKVDSAIKDSLGQNISTTYIKDISINSNNIITTIKGNDIQNSFNLNLVNSDINGLMSSEDKIKLDSIKLENLLSIEEANNTYAIKNHTHNSEEIVDIDTKLNQYLTENNYLKSDEAGGIISNSSIKWANPINLSISGAVTAAAKPLDGSIDVDLVTTSVDATKLSGKIPVGNLTGSYNIDISGKSATAEKATMLKNSNWNITVENNNLVIKNNNIVIFTFKNTGEFVASTLIEK